MRIRLARLAPVAFILALSPAARTVLAADAANRSPFLHIEVNEDKADGTALRINLPLAAAEMALDLAPDNALKGGRLKIDTEDVKVADLLRMWNALKAGGDADLVQAENGKESVHIAQKNGRVLITVTERGRAKPKVNVDVPAAVVDALLSGEGGTLDLRAALAELHADTKGELLQIDDGSTRVRVWID